MKKLLLALVMLPISYVGSIAFGAVATLNGAIPINTTTLNAGNVATYWQTCIDQTNSNDNVQRAIYVGQDIFPKFGYTYSNTNATRARALLDSTEMLIYNPSTFSTNGQFSFLSNINPNLNSPNPFSIVVTQLNNTVTATNNTIGRSAVVGMYILHGAYQTFTFAGNTNANIYGYRTSYSQSPATYFNKNLSDGATPVERFSCVRYFVAKCGDGVKDNPNKTCLGGANDCDGKSGIYTIANLIQPWASTPPTEQCDGNDGVPSGYTCTSSCTLQELIAPPTCILSVSSGSVVLGTSLQVGRTINGAYTNNPQIRHTPIAWGMLGLPYNVPASVGQHTITPQHTGTYTLSMTVINGAGQDTCTAQVNVTPQPEHVSCTLSVTPNPVYVNDLVSVGWNITGGTFFSTYIHVTPSLVGSWPYPVYTNQYSGSNFVNPTQTGNYLFSMIVSNYRGSYLCTGQLTVISHDLPTCSLTTTTPLINSGDTAILNGSYTNASLATMTPNIIGLNFLYPNRSNPSIAVNPTQTTTYTMNVLGVGGTGPAVCSTTVQVTPPTPTINFDKSLVTDVLYHSGELVTFRIDFSNAGVTAVNHVIISDVLPTSLEYVSSQIFGISSYAFGTGTLGGDDTFEYSGFNLAPGQAGYILVVGRFKGYMYSNDTINNAFFASDEVPFDYDAAAFTPYAPTANATITKTANHVSYYPGEDAQFIISVMNNGPDIIDNVQLIDTWPTNNNSCLTIDPIRTTNTPMTMTNNVNPYTWALNTSLPVGQMVYLYLTGHITNDPSCVGSYTNNVDLTYLVNGQLKTGHANTTINVSTTPSSTMTIEKNVVSYGNNAGDPIVFELIYKNNGTATITNYTIVDYWPGTLTFVSASPMPTTQTPTLGGSLLNWTFTNPIAPNGTGIIIINGKIN